jgi:hypothetical protein
VGDCGAGGFANRAPKSMLLVSGDPDEGGPPSLRGIEEQE